ncbi:MAG: calcium/sodium antiporter [Candidatus Omnitrophica bacterium]|nr:calcium/sodium antiporter [Candidatus Omnitrophota bacterium]
MLLHSGLLIIGLVLVIKGGDIFVDASVHIAEILRIPRVIIGGTLVALATTGPELVVSSMASLAGDSGIAIGNAVGSVIANIALGIGCIACMTTISTESRVFKSRAFYMGLLAVLVVVVSFNLVLSSTMGCVLLILGVAYLISNMFFGKKEVVAAEQEIACEAHPSLAQALLLFIVGAVLVVGGSRLLVDSGSAVARGLGIPSVIIGLTVIAVGTSLPELVTAVTAARKKIPDLSIGNIIGANILNLSIITGTAALIHPLSITRFTQVYSFPWLLIFIFAFSAMVLRPRIHIDRKQGIVLLVLYAIYVVGLVVTPIISR